MPRGDLLRAKQHFQDALNTREETPTRIRALVGDGAGNIVVTGKRNHIYIRRLGRSRVEECLNTRVPRRNNLKIIVGYTSDQPDVLQVLEPDWGGMAQPNSYHYMPYHHEAHEFENIAGGDDVTWIQSQQFVPLLVYPTDPVSMQVNVYGGWYPWATSWHYFDAIMSDDLTGSIPAAAGFSVYVLVSIDGATEALQYTTGVAFPTALPPADREAMIPAAPAGSIPLAGICLTNGMTEIDWSEIYDLRLMGGQPTGGSISPPCGDWVGLNAAGAASWQPDSVAVLHNGQITEYADPDDAFTAAVAGDVILVPDGTWTLSASHALTSIDVAGIAGTRDGCILQATTDVGATLLTIDDGEISDVTVTYSTDNAAARTALKLIATTAASYAFNVRLQCENDTGDVIGLWIDSSYAFNCLIKGTCNGANNATGTYIYNGVLERSRSIAYNNGAGHAYGVEVDTAGYTRWCYLYGSAGAGNGYGIYLQGSANAWAYHCELVGSDFDIGILALATLYVYSDIYDTVSNLGTLTHDEGDRAGKARDETIAGTWTFNEEITQAEQGADPGGPGAGYGRTYFKDDGTGQTKEFFQDDTGSVFEKAGIVEDITVTVGVAGDFATLQGAIDYFRKWIIKGACVISEIDSASYDEAVSFDGILIAPGSSLRLRGDIRTLAGLSYVVGAICNPQALANGGTFNNLNRCTLTVNAAGDQITVSGGTVDPDFDDGVTGVWGDGDYVLIFGNDDTIYECEVNAILGANDNIVELKVALPAAAFPGGGGALDDGSAICLLPNRRITQAAGYTVTSTSVRGVGIDGFTLKNTGASALWVTAGSVFNLDRVAFWSASYGAYVSEVYSALRSTSNNPVSAWGCVDGIRAAISSQAVIQYPVCVGCTRGVRTSYFSMSYHYKIIATHCTEGIYSQDFSYTYVQEGTARQCTTGYYAERRAYIYALLSNANNNGNGANYNPAISDAWGNNNGSITWS